MWMFASEDAPAAAIVEAKDGRALPSDTAARLAKRLQALGFEATTEMAGRTVVVHIDVPIAATWLEPGGLSAMVIDEERTRRFAASTPEQMRADPDMSIRRVIRGESGWLVLAQPILIPTDVASATAVFSQEAGPYVDLTLTPEGRERLATGTTELAAAKGRFALLVGGKLLSTPKVMAPIPTGKVRVSDDDPTLLAAQISSTLPDGLVVRATP